MHEIKGYLHRARIVDMGAYECQQSAALLIIIR